MAVMYGIYQIWQAGNYGKNQTNRDLLDKKAYSALSNGIEVSIGT